MKRYRLSMDSTTHKVHLDEDAEGRYCEFTDYQHLQEQHQQLMDQYMALKARVAIMEQAVDTVALSNCEINDWSLLTWIQWSREK